MHTAYNIHSRTDRLSMRLSTPQEVKSRSIQSFPWKIFGRCWMQNRIKKRKLQHGCSGRTSKNILMLSLKNISFRMKARSILRLCIFRRKTSIMKLLSVKNRLEMKTGSMNTQRGHALCRFLPTAFMRICGLLRLDSKDSRLSAERKKYSRILPA